MLKRLSLAAVCAAALAAHPAAIQAQTSHAHIGLHVLYNTTFEDGGIGAQFSLPLARHLEFYPSVDVYFQSGETVWQPNFDIKYRILGDHYDWFYVGTGVGILEESADGQTASRGEWNLFAGIESLKGNIHPFAEARAGVANRDQFQLQAGINITIGKH